MYAVEFKNSVLLIIIEKWINVYANRIFTPNVVATSALCSQYQEKLSCTIKLHCKKNVETKIKTRNKMFRLSNSVHNETSQQQAENA